MDLHRVIHDHYRFQRSERRNIISIAWEDSSSSVRVVAFVGLKGLPRQPYGDE